MNRWRAITHLDGLDTDLRGLLQAVDSRFYRFRERCEAALTAVAKARPGLFQVAVDDLVLGSLDRTVRGLVEFAPSLVALEERHRALVRGIQTLLQQAEGAGPSGQDWVRRHGERWRAAPRDLGMVGNVEDYHLAERDLEPILAEQERVAAMLAPLRLGMGALQTLLRNAQGTLTDIDQIDFRERFHQLVEEMTAEPFPPQRVVERLRAVAADLQRVASTPPPRPPDEAESCFVLIDEAQAWAEREEDAASRTQIEQHRAQMQRLHRSWAQSPQADAFRGLKEELDALVRALRARAASQRAARLGRLVEDLHLVQGIVDQASSRGLHIAPPRALAGDAAIAEAEAWGEELHQVQKSLTAAVAAALATGEIESWWNRERKRLRAALTEMEALLQGVAQERQVRELAAGVQVLLLPHDPDGALVSLRQLVAVGAQVELLRSSIDALKRRLEADWVGLRTRWEALASAALEAQVHLSVRPEDQARLLGAASPSERAIAHLEGELADRTACLVGVEAAAAEVARRRFLGAMDRCRQAEAVLGRSGAAVDPIGDGALDMLRGLRRLQARLAQAETGLQEVEAALRVEAEGLGGQLRALDASLLLADDRVEVADRISILEEALAAEVGDPVERVGFLRGWMETTQQYLAILVEPDAEAEARWEALRGRMRAMMRDEVRRYASEPRWTRVDRLLQGVKAGERRWSQWGAQIAAAEHLFDQIEGSCARRAAVELQGQARRLRLQVDGQPPGSQLAEEGRAVLASLEAADPFSLPPPSLRLRLRAVITQIERRRAP